MLTVFVFLIGVANISVFSLECHICKNSVRSGDGALCYELEFAEGKFLRKCNSSDAKCAVLKKRGYTDPYIIRTCVTSSWNCDTKLYKCKTCSENGCNTDNEITQEYILAPPGHLGDVLQSNIYSILISALLVTLLLVWCGIRCISRKRENDLEDEIEDDCDEYYENETNIDCSEEQRYNGSKKQRYYENETSSNSSKEQEIDIENDNENETNSDSSKDQEITIKDGYYGYYENQAKMTGSQEQGI